MQVLTVLAPTMNFQLGDIWRIPYFDNRPREVEVSTLVIDNVQASKEDWDSLETSWDFKRHPLI